MLILKKFTSFRSFLWFLVALLFAIYLLFGYKYKFIYNYGQSMHPTYKHGEWIIIERIPKNWTPSKGDVIVFQNGWEKLTKRVIALPGEEAPWWSCCRGAEVVRYLGCERAPASLPFKQDL